jgi:hypothetical protein
MLRYGQITMSKHSYVTGYLQGLLSHVNDSNLFVDFTLPLSGQRVACKLLYSTIRAPSDRGEPDLTEFDSVFGSFRQAGAE